MYIYIYIYVYIYIYIYIYVIPGPSQGRAAAASSWDLGSILDVPKPKRNGLVKKIGPFSKRKNPL